MLYHNAPMGQMGAIFGRFDRIALIQKIKVSKNATLWIK
jgi:hypothetical protein